VKIAYVVHDYHRRGGHSRYVAELATRFSREHEVHVFANRVEPEAEARIHFHHIPALRLSALVSVLSFQFGAVGRVRGDFDIVHAQGMCGWRYDVLTAHICNRAWYRARRAHGMAVGWRERLSDRVFDGVVTPLEALLYRTSRDRWVIAISDVTRRNLAECYGRRERTAVIHHGVDTSLFQPAARAQSRTEMRRELGYDETDFVALYVGNLQKGAAFALRALRHAPQVKLLCVSLTPPEPYLVAADRAGLTDRVQFRPATNVIERYYAAADAFVFPSPYEAFGMVITEAMAAGLPVVTSRAAGAAELIAHGREGLLLDDPADAREIAAHLNRLVEDRDFCREVGEAAARRVEVQGWERVAAQTMEIYRRALAERAR
jgi:UDP-glucose:(heptosyl)LPS alpha-1,3-glucosyltransferase